MSWLVYKHTSPSYKVYIGVTHFSPERRWLNGLGYKQCPLFYKAVLKYGWESIEHKVLIDKLTEEEAKDIERQLISYYKSISMSYNISDGGDGTLGMRHSEEWKQKMSKFKREHPISREDYEKGLKKRREHPFKHTEEAKRRIGEAAKKQDHTKAAQAAGLVNSKPVMVKDEYNNIVATFPSQRALAKFYNVSEWKVSTYANTNKMIDEVGGFIILQAKLKD